MLSGRHIQVDRDDAGNSVVSGNGRVIVIDHGGVSLHDPARANSATADPAPATPEVGGDAETRAPYPGMAPFEVEDATRFFGRATEVEGLWTSLRHMLRPADIGSQADGGAPSSPRMLAVIGPAGSGKTSLIRAGLATELARWPLPKWSLVRVILLRTGQRPLADLAEALHRLVAGAPAGGRGATGLGQEVGDPASAEDLAGRLAAPDDEGRHDELSKLVSSVADPVTAPLILVIDPAEDAYLSGSDSAERFAFADNIFRAAAEPQGPLVVVLVLRGESLEAVVAHPPTRQALSRHAFLLPALTQEGLRTAVRRPAKEAGVPIERATEDLLVRECQGLSPCLPPLQLALSEIWAGLLEGRRPMETYLRLGGVKNAIEWRCEQIYQAFDQDQQDALREAFVALVGFGEITLEEAAAGANGPVPASRVAAAQLLQPFAAPGVGLVVLRQDRGRVTARLSYEVIAEHWRRLRDWLARPPVPVAGGPVTREPEPPAPGTSNPEARDRADSADQQVSVLRRLHSDGHEGGAQPPVLRSPPADDPSASQGTTGLSPVGEPEGEPGDEPRDELGGQSGILPVPQAPRREPAPESAPESARELALEPPRRRHRNALVTVLVACLAGALLFAGFAERERQQMAADKLVSERGRAAALHSQSRYLAQLSLEQAAAGDSETALLIALEALPNQAAQPDRPFVPEAEGALYRALLSHRELAVLTGHGARIDLAAFSPDGARIVTASADGTARLWDAANGRELVSLGDHDNAVKHAAFSPDGALAVTASASPEVRLWAVEDGRELQVLSGHQAWVNHAAFSPDGSRLISASVDRTARLWEVATGRQLRVLSGHEAWVTHASFSPDGTRAVTASADQTARLWTLASDAAPVVLSGHTDSVDHASFSADGTRIVTASADGTARLWDGRSGKPLAVLEGHGAGVGYAEFDAEGRAVVTASADRTARLWDAEDGREINRLLGHASLVTHATFSPDGERIATASADGTARIWDRGKGWQIAVLAGHGAWANHVAFSADGRKLVTTHRDGTARLWDALSGREVTVLSAHQDWINDVAFSPDSALVLTASRDGSARLWRREDGRPKVDLLRHEGWINRAAFSASGDRVVTASGDATARLWDTASGEVIAVLAAHQGWINHAAFSADGSLLVTASVDGTARVWDAADGRALAQLSGHEAWVNHAEFSPDGTRIVTASGDGTARVWDAVSGAQTLLLAGHKDWVNAARFSPDGGTIVTASGDGVARLWDAAGGTVLATLSGHREWVSDAGFSPDGKLVVTASADGTARLWRVPDGREVAVLTGHSLGVNQAVFTGDGSRVVTASGDGSVRLWDVATGREVIALAGHGAAVNRVALSPDGQWVATASADGTAQIVPLYGTEALLKRARALVKRGLSEAERRRFFLEPSE